MKVCRDSTGIRVAQDGPDDSEKDLPDDHRPNYEPDDDRPNNPSQLDIPSFLMCFPFSLHTDNPNNVWMKELPEEERQVNWELAYTQVHNLMTFVGGSALLYNLPAGVGNFQDLIYVANIGIYLPHVPEQDTIIVSKFKSKPRRGEDRIGLAFFKMMGYKVFQPPYFWEGEADLKYLRDNIYIGGHGIRTNPKSYKWMTDNFDMRVLPVKMTDEYLYHFDCLCSVATKDTIFLATELLSKSDVRRIEKVANVIPVDKEMAYNGATNTVRMFSTILCASPLASLDRKDGRYHEEKRKVEYLVEKYGGMGLDVSCFNLSEIEKSGAQLSCMIMHLNYCDQLEDVT